MKKLLDTIQDTPILFGYFVLLTGAYGLSAGCILGTAILPFLGTAVGTLIGLGVGLGSGFVLAFCIIPLHLLFFTPDINLEVYRRYLARSVGVFSMALGLVGGVLLIRKIWLLYSLQPVMWLYVLCGIGLVVMWWSLTLAYIANGYPDYLIQQNLLEKYPDYVASVHEHRCESELDCYMSSFYPGGAPMSLITGLIGTVLCVIVILLIRNPSAGKIIEAIILSGAFGFFVGMMSPSVFALYWVFGSGELIKFLKRVIFADLWPDPDPETYRRVLCAIAFVFTLVTTWWTLVLAPLLALHVARTLYTHALTLPPNGIKKAKRKEATSTI